MMIELARLVSGMLVNRQVSRYNMSRHFLPDIFINIGC